MSTKVVNKIYVESSDVQYIVDGCIKKKTKGERYLFFPEKQFCYDKKTGYLFPSIHTKSQVSDNKTVLKRDHIETIFGNFYFSQKAKGKIIYVDSDNDNADPNGSSWDLAFPNFDSALAIAKPNDQIWVAKGDYHGNFELPEGITLYGGFGGWERECWQRNSKINTTTFSGDNKAASVFNVKNTTMPVTISGITITNPHGRAFHSQNAKVTISQCKLEDTITKDYGGAIYCLNSQLIISDCLFNNNHANSYYSTHILYSQDSQVYLLNSRLQNDHLDIIGCFGSNSSFTITDSHFFLKNQKHEVYINSSYSQATICDKLGLPTEIYTQVYAKEIIAKKIVKDPNNNYEALQSLIAEGLLSLDRSNFKDDSELKKIGKYLINRDSKSYFDLEKIIADLQTKKLTLNSFKLLIDKVSFIDEVASNKTKLRITQESVHELLLNCEKRRANITPYDSKILTDINQGHWDIWSDDSANKIEFELKEKLIARNPKSSVKENSVVAIDFGTKSTVVVYHDENNTTLPIRVGDGDVFKELSQKQYENPTVIEFIDLESFLTAYRAKNGRPSTRWEDITVSHTAFNNLLNNSSELFYTVLSDLKQWAGNSSQKLFLKDKKNSDQLIELPQFLNLKDDDLNPIEIYAYYIGLFINNMYQGISTSYLLSFPVTYEKEVREKIQKSFYNGIKKSLPETLIKDKKFMKDFTVTAGSSEPAAYAVCALSEYGFEPEGDEVVFYAVFDFGGGTADFDFGIWKESSEYLIFDYEIEHFSSKGDKYLGGENLLELLSFEIFKDNISELKESKISFTLPPEQKKFPGCEAVLKVSQEAKMNMKQLVETIRPFWESRENFEYLEKGQLFVNLINNEGRSLPNYELKFNQDKLDKILRDRIETGVINFFESLRLAFERPGLEKIDKVNIFLAGNSSKSPIVKELFDKHIAEKTINILKTNNPNKELFELFPPLGTELASNKLKERGVVVAEDQSMETLLTKPTGKTGVAYGLIESRVGGRIKVINHNFEANKEVKFKYFLGINRKKKFCLIIDNEFTYNKWYKFTPAGQPLLEIYFTPSASATTSKLPITETKKVIAKLDEVDMTKNVYIKAIKSDVIQYAVALKEDIEKKDNNELKIQELTLRF